ncbi:MAG: hypothetical protein ACSLE1_16300 [Sphingobium sp.]
MNTLAQRYPDHWNEWSPARRKAEVALNKACRRAEQRRDAVLEKAHRLMREANERYYAEREAALRVYSEGEG